MGSKNDFSFDLPEADKTIFIREQVECGCMGKGSCKENREVKFRDGTKMPSILSDGSDGPRCHDCGCLPGKRHHPGCDMEKCPRCKEQAIGCDCLNDWKNYRKQQDKNRKTIIEKMAADLNRQVEKEVKPGRRSLRWPG